MCTNNIYIYIYVRFARERVTSLLLCFQNFRNNIVIICRVDLLRKLAVKKNR